MPTFPPGTTIVNTPEELNAAIATVNSCTSQDPCIIAIGSSFTTTDPITPINAPNVTLNIQSSQPSAVTLDGGGACSGFVVLNGAVTFENLNINNMCSKGAPGCLGAGGGIFIANTSGYPAKEVQYTPTVTLSSVSFSGCTAQGGDMPSSAAQGGAGGAGGQDTGGGGVDGANGLGASGNNVFGGPAESGAFGQLGSGGSGGNSGGIQPPSSDGAPGNPGSAGAASGYGAGESGGGGGGGGGGGINGGCFRFWCSSGGDGGGGGNGGKAGPIGFGGGGSGFPPTNGSDGADNDGQQGGSGGAGGNGNWPGAGAGLGGALFAMDNATIIIMGSGTISGNQASGGTSNNTKASGCGGGMFLQGSGELQFNLDASDTYTINDEFADETGAVRNGDAAPVSGITGPDGLPTGGGGGLWTIHKSGKGTLVLSGRNLLSGGIKTSGGTITLSNYEPAYPHDLHLHAGVALIHQPPAKRLLRVSRLTLSDTTVLRLNSRSRIKAAEITFSGSFSIVLDSADTGFVKGVPVQLISWKNNISAEASAILVSTGFECRIVGNAINIARI